MSQTMTDDQRFGVREEFTNFPPVAGVVVMHVQERLSPKVKAVACTASGPEDWHERQSDCVGYGDDVAVAKPSDWIASLTLGVGVYHSGISVSTTQLRASLIC